MFAVHHLSLNALVLALEYDYDGLVRGSRA